MIKTIIPPSAMMVACIFLMWQALGFTSSYSASTFYGPAFFPSVVLGALILISLLQIAHVLRSHARPSAEYACAEGEEDVRHDRPDIAAFAITLSAAILYVVGMQYVGFLPATVVFQAAIFGLVFGMRTLNGLVLLPGLLTTIYFIIFLRLLELPLPQGQGVFRQLSRLVYY